jgi:hypothetical protein
MEILIIIVILFNGFSVFNCLCFNCL